MRWAGRIVRIGDRRGAYEFGGKRLLGNVGVNGRIVLKWFFKMWDWDACTGLKWYRVETGGERL
jgi:hypothetical protein